MNAMLPGDTDDMVLIQVIDEQMNRQRDEQRCQNATAFTRFDVYFEMNINKKRGKKNRENHERRKKEKKIEESSSVKEVIKHH